jgi:hypothetical protein
VSEQLADDGKAEASASASASIGANAGVSVGKVMQTDTGRPGPLPYRRLGRFRSEPDFSFLVPADAPATTQKPMRGRPASTASEGR